MTESESLEFEDMDDGIQFFVPGIPRPGGSKRFVGIGKRTGRAILIDAGGDKTKFWRASVAQVGSEVCDAPLTGPLFVQFYFLMPRPKGHFHTSKKRKGQLREDAPTYHINAPDTTKLIRSTEDALKGIAWIDDSQIAKQAGAKNYGERTGCLIIIKELK